MEFTDEMDELVGGKTAQIVDVNATTSRPVADRLRRWGKGFLSRSVNFGRLFRPTRSLPKRGWPLLYVGQ